MRRLIVVLTAGLALATFGCSSSDEPSASDSSTTTSSFAVAEENKAACESLSGFADAVDAGLVADSSDPAANAKNIQDFVSSLVAPLEAAKADAPPEVASAIDVLLANGETATALDPSVAADQQTLGRLILVPTPEVSAAQATVSDWATANCGFDTVAGT